MCNFCCYNAVTLYSPYILVFVGSVFISFPLSKRANAALRKDKCNNVGNSEEAGRFVSKAIWFSLSEPAIKRTAPTTGVSFLSFFLSVFCPFPSKKKKN